MEALGFLRPLMQSALYVRVSLVMWGVPLVGFAGAVLWHLRPEDVGEWFLVVGFGALALFGTWLCCLAFSSPRRLAVARDFLATCTDPIGALLALGVALIAVPVTMLLRVAGVADE